LQTVKRYSVKIDEKLQEKCVMYDEKKHINQNIYAKAEKARKEKFKHKQKK
jgi:hypothetical protein